VSLTTYPKSAKIGRSEHPQKGGESWGDDIFKGGEAQNSFTIHFIKKYYTLKIVENMISNSKSLFAFKSAE